MFSQTSEHQREIISDLKDEIERLRAEPTELQPKYTQALRDLGDAKAENAEKDKLITELRETIDKCDTDIALSSTPGINEVRTTKIYPCLSIPIAGHFLAAISGDYPRKSSTMKNDIR